jgi:hypothetical protein
MPNLPDDPEPQRPREMSDKQYRQWKQEHREWKNRQEWRKMIQGGGSDPARNEDEAIERARQRGDKDFEQGVEDILGYSLDEVREAFRKEKDENLSIAEREVKRALERADKTIFFKASAQKHAQKKIKGAKKDIQKRIKKSKCSLFALLGLAIGSFEMYVIASGIHEAVSAIMG